MNTPHIDSFFTEVAALRSNVESLDVANQRLRNELAAKQASWDKAANYRDRMLELIEQGNAQSKRIEELCEEKAALEKRVLARCDSDNYHMGCLDRLCAFVKPKDKSSNGVVEAAIDWVNRLIEANTRAETANGELADERDRLRRKLDEVRKIIH